MAQPASVVITDVALRDGLQIQPRTVPTDTKLELYERLRAAGVRSVEVGSFVSPRLVPQMADADELFRRLPPPRTGRRSPWCRTCGEPSGRSRPGSGTPGC